MIEKSKKYLFDILKAIELIEDFSEGLHSFTVYQKDFKTQSAIERQLVIIGEALNQLRKISPDLEISGYHQIVGFRNRLVHAYDSIDNTIVWAILKRHLPKLKKETKNLL